MVDLSSELGSLQNDAFGAFGSTTSSTSFAIPSQGGGVASDVTALRGTVDAINTDTDQLSSAAALLGNASSADALDYVSLKTELLNAKDFLDIFAPWIATTTPHHVLVLLQNPSELRASGGFLGSYADVTIVDGRIAQVAVHDVADVDKGFAPDIVPPLALQSEAKLGRPRTPTGSLIFRRPHQRRSHFSSSRASMPCRPLRRQRLIRLLSACRSSLTAQ